MDAQDALRIAIDVVGVDAVLGGMDKMRLGILGVVGAIDQTVKSSIDFTQTLTEVQNNTTMTDAQMGQLRQTVLAMGTATGASLDGLARGMEHAQNEGYNLADSTRIVDAAQKSAIATGADLSQTINTVASTMRAYNLPADQAVKVTDLLHNAAANSNARMQDFVSGGQKAISMAANLGVSLQDVTSVLGALTLHLGDVSVGSTQVVGMFTHIINPTKAAQAEIEKLSKTTGIDLVHDFSLAGLQEKQLSGVMQDVMQATRGQQDEVIKLIPALRGGQGALALTGMAAGDLTRILQSQATVISGQYTPSADGLARTQATLANQLQVLSTRAQIAAIAVGDNLLKVFTDFEHASPLAVAAIAALSAALAVLAVNAAAAGIAMLIAAAPVVLPILAIAAAVGGAKLAWDALNSSAKDTAQSVDTATAAVNNFITACIPIQTATTAPLATTSAAFSHVSDTATAATLTIEAHARAVAAAAAQHDSGAGAAVRYTAAWGLIKDMTPQATAAIVAGADATRKAADAMDAACNDTAMAFHLMDDKTAKAVDGVVKSIEKIAADTLPSAKKGAQGVAEAWDLLRTDIPAALGPLPDDVQALFDRMKNGGTVSAQELHTAMMGWITRLHTNANAEVRAMADDMQATLDALVPAVTGIGNATGAAYIENIVKGHLAGFPAFNDLIKATIDNMNIADIAKMMGGTAGREYMAEMAVEMANGLTRLAAAISALPLVGAKLAQPIKDMAATLKQGALDTAADLGLIGAHFGRTSAEIQKALGDANKKFLDSMAVQEQHGDKAMAAADKAAAAAAKHADAQAAAAAAAATAAEKSADSIIKDMGRADMASVDGTHTWAQAVSDLIPILNDKLPKSFQWLKSDYQQLLKDLQSATPPTLEEIHQRFDAWLAQLAHSNDVQWRTIAQAQIDAVTQAEQKIATSTANTAQHFEKEQQAVVASVGKLAEDLTKKHASIGDAEIGMLDLIDSATKAKLPQVAQFAQDQYNAMASGHITSVQQEHDQVIALLQDLADHGSAVTRAWAQAQLADIAAADQAAADAVQKTADAAAKAQAQAVHSLQTSLDSLVDVASSGGSKGTILDDLLKAADAAANAHLPALQQKILGWFDTLQAGGTLSAADMEKQVVAWFHQLVTDGDREGAALEQVYSEHVQALHDKAVAAAQKTGVDVAKALGGSAVDLLGKTDDVPKALTGVFDMIDKLRGLGQNDWAAHLLADAQAVAKGVPGAIGIMSADVLSYLVQMEQSTDPVIAAWAAYQIEQAAKARDGVAQAAQQTAQAAAQAAQQLATALGAVGQAILSGKDSPLQALIALGPLAKAAIDAGLPQVADQIKALMEQAAHGGAVSFQQLMAIIQQAEAALLQSGDATAAVLAQQAAAEMAQAQAVAAASAALKDYQAQAQAAQAAVTANSQALQDQQAVLTSLNQAYNDAVSQINNLKSTQLTGEGAANEQIFAAQQKVLAAKVALDQAKVAGVTGAGLNPYQAALTAAQDQLTLLQDQTAATFDPLKHALDDAAKAATGANKELSFADAIKGIQEAGAKMHDLAPKIHTAELAVIALKKQQDILKESLALANQQVQNQQTYIQQLQTASSTYTGTLGTMTTATQDMGAAVQTSINDMLANAAKAITDSGNSHTGGAVAAAWFGDKGLLTEMLKRVGGVGEGQSFSGAFRPNVIAAFNQLVNEGIPGAIDSGMPSVVSGWQGYMTSLKQAAHDAVDYILNEFAKLKDLHLPSLPQGPQSNTAFTNFVHNGTASNYAASGPAFVNHGPITIHARTEGEGRAAARGFVSEVGRLSGDLAMRQRLRLGAAGLPA